MDQLGVYLASSSSTTNDHDKLIKYARAVELGRVVGRDIGGGDPERMAPPRVADYVYELFGSSSGIKVRHVLIWPEVHLTISDHDH